MDLNNVKYSVLMSVYYKENPDFLMATIKSILNQTYKADEIVIVEDGPLTDELNMVINSFINEYSKLFKLVKLEKNSGLGIALHEGILNCKNELIARFDSDDISDLTRCEKQINEFIKDDKLDLVGSRHVEFIDTKENIVSYKNLPLSDEEIKKYARRRNPISHSAVMFKKSKVIEAGNYREYYYLEDYDLWVRMIQIGCKFLNLKEYLSYVRVSKDLYKRRGGIKYLGAILKFKKELYKNGFYSLKDYVISSTSHIIVCLMPGSIRQFVYKKMLRS